MLQNSFKLSFDWILGRKLFTGEALAQVAQGICGCPNPGSVQAQVQRGLLTGLVSVLHPKEQQGGDRNKKQRK